MPQRLRTLSLAFERVSSFVPFGAARTDEVTVVQAESRIGEGRQALVVLLKIGQLYPEPSFQRRVVVNRNVISSPVGGEKQRLIGRELTRVHTIEQCSPGDLQARRVQMGVGEEITRRNLVPAL